MRTNIADWTPRNTFMTCAIWALLIVVTPQAASAADAKSAIPQLSGLDCTPTTVSSAGSTNCTVSLSAAVPGVLNKGGEPVVVSLTWPTGSRDVSILPGQTHWSVVVPLTNSSPVSVQAAIQAQYKGLTKAVTVTILPNVLKRLAIQPHLGIGDAPSYAFTGTVTLAAPAPPGGLKARLDSHSPAVVSVPSNVTVPNGQTEASFPIIAKLVTSTTYVKITASANWQGDVDQTSDTMTILPQGLKRLAIQPPQGIGGSLSYAPKGTVTLAAPAPPGGLKIRLGGDSPAVVTLEAAAADLTLAAAPTTIAIIPSAVTVPSGQTEATFPILAKPVAGRRHVMITASSNWQNDADQTSQEMYVDPPHLLEDLGISHSGNTNAVPLGGMPITLTAYLSSPAGPATFIHMSYTGTGTVTGPEKFEISAGQTEGSYTVTLFPCETEWCGVTFTAKFNSDTTQRSTNYHNPAAAASTSSPVGQAGATPTVRWTTAPNATLKEATGRLVMNFLKDVEYRFSRVEVFPTGGTTSTKMGYGSSEIVLPPSNYDVAVNGARVPQVPITQGADTRLLVGALQIQAGAETRVEVWDAGRTQLLQWTLGNAVVGLPIGPYAIKIGKGPGTFSDVMIEDAKATDFRAP
jgi:hypothetical protein